MQRDEVATMSAATDPFGHHAFEQLLERAGSSQPDWPACPSPHETPSRPQVAESPTPAPSADSSLLLTASAPAESSMHAAAPPPASSAAHEDAQSQSQSVL
eukprot:11033473-Karenia_brevis.AAC.1